MSICVAPRVCAPTSFRRSGGRRHSCGGNFQQADHAADIELLSCRNAVSMAASSWRAVRAVTPRKSLVTGGPTGPARGGERGPSGLQRVVEHVPVGEVFDQEAIRITPIVEDLAALNVASDAPGSDIASCPEVFAAGGQCVRSQTWYAGVDVTIGRPQCQGQGVMVGRG